MPVVDAVAGDYLDDVAFLAVAGRSTFDRTAPRAAELFGENLAWGFDESVWDLFGVFGQPFTVLVSGDVIVASWFGALGEQEIRSRLDGLIDWRAASS
ncbi:MAG: TlpA family protein disulfide reductase [Acidimicrobiia bacterium]